MENNYAIMVGMIVIGIVVGLVILTLLVVAHEWGHFIMARKNGVEVKEFGIGFPPRAGTGLYAYANDSKYRDMVHWF